MPQTITVLVSLFILIIVALFAGSYLENKNLETFENRKSYKKMFHYKKRFEDEDILLQGVYPIIHEPGITANSITDVWWKRPIFPVGSYAQITNNLRYRKNPDDGECTTIDFCDSLYKDIRNKSNYVFPLPPVPTELKSGTKRVNYFNTPYNLFLGNQAVELPVFQ